MKLFPLILLIGMTSAYAETPLPQCQSEESRAARYIAQGMMRAAEESAPFRNCSSGCSMASSLADTMRNNSEYFVSQSRASLYRARALEAAKCPQYAEQIMEGVTPLTDTQKKKVASDFQTAMDKEYAELAALKAWQTEHPQCKHVVWWSVSGGGSKEDFSGRFQDREHYSKPFDAGWCSADSKGLAWRGTEDSLAPHDPDQNKLIAQTRCANALREVSAFDGSYTEPKFCSFKID